MDKNKNIVQTRGRRKKRYETSVIGRQEREKSAKYDIFSQVAKVYLFTKQFPTNSKSTIIISRKTGVSRGTHMSLNITYRKVHVSAPGNINS